MHRRIGGALGFGRNKKKDGNRPESQRTVDSIDLEPPPGWVLKRTLDDIPYFLHTQSGVISETNPADEYDDEGDGEPHLRQLQEEVAETRADIATTIGEIENRLRPSALAASAKEAVTDKAASLGDSLASSQPARYARANPWGTALMLTGAAVAVWLMVSPRHPRRPSRRGRRRPGSGHEFTRTHYDAGVEHGLESGANRIPRTSPADEVGAHSQTYGGTTA